MGLFDKFRKKVDKKRLEKSAKKDEVLDLGSKPEKVKKSVVSQKKDDTGRAYHILSRPIITEKLTMDGRYGFRVSSDANKIEISKAVAKVYGVKPVAVNIINVRGRKVRYGRTSGTTSSWKKAIVTLKKGDKIDIVEG
jgi:large subunit ribosomal protein L23